jgi:hypothetical protein
MVSVLGNVLIHLSFKRCQQHAPGALSHQRIQIQLECGLLVGFRSDYAQHAAYLFVDGLTIVRLQQPEGYAALLNSDPIHNFRLYLLQLVEGGQPLCLPSSSPRTIRHHKAGGGWCPPNND